MTECFACHQEITDLKGQDILEIIGTNRMDSGPFFNAFGYTPRIQPNLNHSYIHFPCVSEHSDLLAQRHRNQWLEWRVGQLEQEQAEHRTLMEEITSAIRHIDPDAYYEYIEQPSLNRRDKRQHDPPGAPHSPCAHPAGGIMTNIERPSWEQRLTQPEVTQHPRLGPGDGQQGALPGRGSGPGLRRPRCTLEWAGPC